MKIINPEYRANAELGHTDAQWSSLKDKITVYLKTKASQSTVLISDIRSIDSAFKDDKIWRQIASDMKLFEIP